MTEENKSEEFRSKDIDYTKIYLNEELKPK